MGKTSALANKNYDYFGITLSALCGVHCLLTPLLIIYLPSLGAKLESAWIHALLIGIVILAFHQSILAHYKVHRSKLIIGLGIVGVAILFGTSLSEVFAHAHSHKEGHHEDHWITYITLFGAALLIASHLLNLRMCRCIQGEGHCLKGANEQ